MKNVLVPILQLRNHALSEDINGIDSVVFIDRVSLAKERADGSQSNSSTFSALRNESRSTKECLSQRSAYDDQPSKSAVNKLVHGGQKIR